jgi:hexosaminidase
MVFPRMPAYAEIGWTPAELRNWEDFSKRIGRHGAFFRAMDINYYPSSKINWMD